MTSICDIVKALNRIADATVGGGSGQGPAGPAGPAGAPSFIRSAPLAVFSTPMPTGDTAGALQSIPAVSVAPIPAPPAGSTHTQILIHTRLDFQQGQDPTYVGEWSAYYAVTVNGVDMGLATDRDFSYNGDLPFATTTNQTTAWIANADLPNLQVNYGTQQPDTAIGADITGVNTVTILGYTTATSV